ncbi:peptidase inhibitor family I36 protein [Streptomyces sp. NPDC047985]|uniref:peptidase inhibitor family I36 protein n=1 Tax=unclassified Streptomyces TaxID=2593676 RepID=UPI00343117AA
MRRIFVPVFAAGFSAALVFGGPASSAAPTVAEGLAACPKGYLCVWDQTDYKGRMYKFKDANASWGNYAIENHDASWYNNNKSGLNACVWQYKGHMGSVKVIKAGTSSPKDANHAHKGSSNSWGDCK